MVRLRRAWHADSGIDQTITLTADGLPDPGNFAASDGSSGYLVIKQGAPTANDVPVTAHVDARSACSTSST